MANLIERLDSLRREEARLTAEQEQSKKQHAAKKASLKELGWDGEQPPRDFLQSVQETAAQSVKEAEAAVANAEAEAKKFTDAGEDNV